MRTREDRFIRCMTLLIKQDSQHDAQEHRQFPRNWIKMSAIMAKMTIFKKSSSPRYSKKQKSGTNFSPIGPPQAKKTGTMCQKIYIFNSEILRKKAGRRIFFIEKGSKRLKF